MNNIIPIKKGSYIPDIEIKGRTLVNLLGRAGNAVYRDNQNFNHPENVTCADDVFTVRPDSGKYVMLNYDGLQKGKYYIGLMWVNSTVEWGAKVQFSSISDWNSGKHDNGDTINKWRLVYNAAYIPADITEQYFNNVHFQVGWQSDTLVNKIKDIRLYEITKEEYELINTHPEYTGDILDVKYPYVDDVKCVVNPYLESKENLLDGAQLGWYSNNDNEITGDGIEKGPHYGVGSWIPVEPNTTYTLYNPFPHRKAWLAFRNKNREAQISNGWYDEGCNITITSGQNSDAVQILFNNLTDEEADSVRYKATLTKGTEPKKYEECNNSRIMFETKLYDGETISRRNDGTYVKNSEWDEIDIISSRYFLPEQNENPGFKAIHLPDISMSTVPSAAKCIRYDGSVLPKHNSGNYKTTEGFHFSLLENNRYDLYLLIPNNITGWGDNYIPTEDEIRAFFLGWSMYKKNTAPNYEIFNGEGEKAWVKLWGGIGSRGIMHGLAYVGSSATYNLPTTMNDQGFVPYKLIYKKETPTVEEVKTHGSLLVKEDVEITSGSGLVLGDKSTVIFNNVNYVINAYDNALSKLKERVERFDKVYNSDGEIVKFKEIVRTSAEGITVGGKSYATIDVKYLNSRLLVDYLTYAADTVTSFDYSFNKPDSVKESISRSQQEVANCFEELTRTKKELERAKEELAQRSNPNLLINGDLQVWQRGTEFTNIEGTKYTADRWEVYKSAAGTAIPNAVKTDKGIKVYASQIATGMLYLSQTIECPKNLWGRKITISYKGDQVYSNINFNSNVVSGSTGADLGQALSPSNDKNKQFTTVVPIGTNAISVLLFVDTSVKTSFEIEWVKAEVGEYATPLSPRQYAEEFDLCQRYYQYTDVAIYSGSSVVGQRVGMTIPLQHKMRTTPSITNLSVDAVGIDTTNYNLTVTSDRIHIASSTTTVNSSNRINFAMYLDAEIY